MNSKVLLLLGLISVCSAQYNLVDSWVGGEIFDNFNYFTGSDPTHGMCYYINNYHHFLFGIASKYGREESHLFREKIDGKIGPRSLSSLVHTPRTFDALHSGEWKSRCTETTLQIWL